VVLGHAKKKDVIDGGVALLARDGDEILTSDAGDLRALVEATGAQVDLIEV
jgi:hypothetical protein